MQRHLPERLQLQLMPFRRSKGTTFRQQLAEELLAGTHALAVPKLSPKKQPKALPLPGSGAQRRLPGGSVPGALSLTMPAGVPAAVAAAAQRPKGDAPSGDPQPPGSGRSGTRRGDAGGAGSRRGRSGTARPTVLPSLPLSITPSLFPLRDGSSSRCSPAPAAAGAQGGVGCSRRAPGSEGGVNRAETSSS